MDQELDELLTNYKGTLSIKDQKIFLQLKHYDHVNLNLINEDGYIEFGKQRKKNSSKLKDDKLTDDLKHESKNGLTNEELNRDKNAKNEQKLTKFMKQFKQQLIKSSIFNFPSNIKLNELIDYDQECLDPRFLLLSFYQLINERKTELNEFVDTNCLAITFVSLSFKDAHLRRIAYTVLAKVRQNLCDDTYGIIWRIVLDQISASLKEDNLLIPPLITSFFVHLIPFIKTPTYSIHEQLIKFLSVHSSFRFKSIANFILSMFVIDDLEHKSFYQEVALLMLNNGLKTEEDFNLCLHSKLIDFLLINYNSSILFKPNLTYKILDIFKLITKLPLASKLMCTEKGFLLWLNQLAIEENKIEVLNKLNQIVSQLNELNCNFYPLFEIELKMIKNVCIKKLDHLFEQND